MLLWDHSVRRLMHTSPPWDVPQASPSAINQVFRSRDAPLNLKLRLVLFQVRSLFSFRPNSSTSHFSQLLYSIHIQLNSMKMLQSVSQSSSRRSKHSEIVFNSFCPPQTHHQFNANHLNLVQTSLHSPSSIVIQSDVPQFVFKCQHCPKIVTSY